MTVEHHDPGASADSLAIHIRACSKVGGALKTCTTCKQEKPEADFNWRRKAKGQRQSFCRACQRSINLAGYYANPAPIRARAVLATSDLKRRFVEWLLLNPCVDCGEADPVVLDCDHVTGNKTPGGVAKLLKSGCSWERLSLELLECQVRCANCHRRKTAKTLGWIYRATVSGCEADMASRGRL